MKKWILSSLAHGKLVDQERSPAIHIPYTRHVTDQFIGLKDGELMAVIGLDGYCFQTADVEDINLHLEERNTAIRRLNDSRYGLYSHIIRREVRPELSGSFDNWFCAELDRRYFEALGRRRMFVNDLYLTIIVRRLQGKIGALDRVMRLVAPGSALVEEESLQESINRLVDVAESFVKELQAYGARILGVVERDGFRYSEPLEFLNQLLNGGQPHPVRLPRMPIDEYIGSRRLIVGHRAIELRGATDADTRFATMLSVREYPAGTMAGMLDGLLHLPQEMIVTQSFSVVDRAEADASIKRLERQTSQSDEGGTGVETEFAHARDQLHSGNSIYGVHHLTVQCAGQTLADMTECARDVGKQLAGMGVLYVREDLNTEAAYWAQLPGNFSYVARGALISSRNFAGFSSLHNFARGQRTGVHWGEAITLLQTTSSTPFYFNFHVRDVGNFTLVGPTGSGKTVALCMLLAQAMRLWPRPRAAFIDKDRGAEVFVRALGGSYEVLRPGVPTGFNPLQLPGDSEDRAFLVELVRYLVRPRQGGSLTAAQDRIISDAVSHLLEMPIADRQMVVLQGLLGGSERRDGDDLVTRLDPWVRGNARGWLFNNPEDRVSFGTVCGFDMTHVLDDMEVRGAALMYIFHRIEKELNGQRFMILLDEAWRYLSDPQFLFFINDKLKTIRKRNGLVGLGTQSAADIVSAQGSHTILEQTKTHLFFPNPKADEASHRDAFQLSPREMRWIRTTLPESRTFLIKHDRDSVIAKLDLSGMGDLVRVLSGRSETIERMEHLRAELGDDTAAWLPAFLREGGS